MSEPGFREIQLNTKQVVFLCMTVVVAAVGVFLLGVHVGRGVTSGRAVESVQAAEPASDIALSGAMPPASSPKEKELGYHEALSGKSAEAAPATPPDVPPDSTPAPKPSPAPAAAPTAKPETPAAKTSAVKTSSLFLQVDQFNSRDNANRQVSQLKAKGIQAILYESTAPGPRYKVRVGPFTDAAALEVMRARLRKEGYKPSPVTR